MEKPFEQSELRQRVQELLDKVNGVAASRGLAGLEQELRQLRDRMARTDFWHDSQQAQQVTKREARLAAQVEPLASAKTKLEELLELVELDDPAMKPEITEQLAAIEQGFEELKQTQKFDGPYDDHDVILNIHAGAGGTDAQDWAQMLLRMYQRWAEAHDLRSQILDLSSGEEAGIKSASLEITGGDHTYAKLLGEAGVHRLVRLSPFNADHKRQTSFAKVEVLPLVDQPGELELDDKDLKVDVFRAGGHGGQSVNTTDSAVRVTHLPTGVSVSIQNERSQLQNKQTALKVLRSKLAALQQQQHVKTLAELKGPSRAVEFGSQDRNYVLHPYKQVKDLRSGYETSDAQAVLDGHLDGLIDTWLGKKPEAQSN